MGQSTETERRWGGDRAETTCFLLKNHKKNRHAAGFFCDKSQQGTNVCTVKFFKT